MTMTDKRTLPHGDAEFITECARGIVSGQLLVADLNNRAWQASLALHMSTLAEYTNIGLILVPFAPHASLHWINGTAPGMTIKCQLLAREDIGALDVYCVRMHAALHPNEPPPQEYTMRVNNVYAEPSKVVDGDVHQDFTEDRLADIAIAYGFELDDDHDPRHWRALMQTSAEQGDGMEEHFGEKLEAASTKLIELLNSRTEGGHFEWVDGSIMLLSDDEVPTTGIDPRLIDPDEYDGEDDDEQDH